MITQGVPYCPNAHTVCQQMISVPLIGDYPMEISIMIFITAILAVIHITYFDTMEVNKLAKYEVKQKN